MDSTLHQLLIPSDVTNVWRPHRIMPINWLLVLPSSVDYLPLEWNTVWFCQFMPPCSRLLWARKPTVSLLNTLAFTIRKLPHNCSHYDNFKTKCFALLLIVIPLHSGSAVIRCGAWVYGEQGGRFLPFALPQLCTCVSRWSLQVWSCVQAGNAITFGLYIFLSSVYFHGWFWSVSYAMCHVWRHKSCALVHMTTTLWSQKEGQSSHMAHKLDENDGDFFLAFSYFLLDSQYYHVVIRMDNMDNGSLINEASARNVFTLHVEVSVAQFFLYRTSFCH